MSIIDRYIMFAVLGLTAIVGLGLVTIYSFINFVSEIDRSAGTEFGAAEIAVYTLYLMPSGLYVLMPLIAMLGTLLGVGQLAVQSELTAMRAAGFSNLRIGRAALFGGLLLGALGVLLGETAAPAGERAAQMLKTEARHGAEAGVSLKPIWLREGPNIFFIRSLRSENHFTDAEIYTLSESLSLQSVTKVDDARYRGSGVWRFEGITRTTFADDGASVEEQAAMDWQGRLSPEVLRLFVLEADDVSARGLWRLAEYLEENGLDASEQRLELWRKFIAPLTVMAMVLFAVPFVFGPTRGGGAGQQLLVGVFVGVGFHLLNELSASYGALYGWPAPMAAGLPTMLLMVAAVVRLLRAR